MSTTYYLDGYNIIHCSKPLKGLAKKSMDAARNSFIKLVAEYCTVTNDRMVLVFDGAEDPAALARYKGEGGKLQIEYCENAMSADTYIGRALYAMDNRLNAVVVTADVSVAQSARGMGALVVAPQSFISQVESTLSESRTKRKTPGREHFGVALSERLSVDARERLQAIRTTVAPRKNSPSGDRRSRKKRAGPKTGS